MPPNPAAPIRLPKFVLPGELIWVFDLDNTLYPASCDLFQQVDQRMADFIVELLGLEWDEARKLQKHYYRTYGTTLCGLMAEHRLDPTRYLDYVHEIDVSAIPPDLRLDQALTNLVGRKLVFTNGSRRHAENVLSRIGIGRHFEEVFDIVAADYVPKPDPACYRAFCARHGVAPERSVLFEDLPRNLVPAHEIGMTTVLVRGNHELTEIAAEGAHIHHVTDNLAEWLERAIAHLASAAPPP
jgi:putative hydrolase of the HAD superfamily